MNKKLVGGEIMKKIMPLIAVVTFVVSLFLVPFSNQVSANHQTGKLNYLIGTGVLCGLPEPNPCPAISMAKNGDTIEVAGEGTIDLDAKSVTGGGTFVHKDEDGNVLGSGDWHAMDLVNFRSWGTQDDVPAGFEGGRAKIRIHLAPSGGGEGFFATMRVICAIGDFPESAHDQEGIELNIRRGPNFKEQVSGLTLFIRTE
ncbi:hypothetical protein HYZ70_00980 [Candidatus Curtissbacteria bacterium]|nr:hypothetical protein [Candidatus Curtissbacteria bacterium]